MGELDRLLGVLGEVRHRLVRIAWVLGPLFGFSLPFAYPWPNPFYNITAQVFLALVSWMLPPGVQLLNIGVGDSILVQMEIGLLLTLILGMPWIIHEVGAFLVPALRRNERALLRQIGIPATVLFALGTGIGVFFLTPFTFRLLFLYVSAMKLAPVLGVQDFVTFALVYSLAFGVVFELPVFIYALTRLGVVKAAWWKHWRGAVIGALVFGMVVTPDNSGITMLMIAAPMIGLYLGGAYFAARWESRRSTTREPPRVAVGAG